MGEIIENAMIFAADRAAEGDRSAAKGGGSGAEVALFLLRLSRNNLTSVSFCRDKIISAENFYPYRTKSALRGCGGLLRGRNEEICSWQSAIPLDIKNVS